MKGREKGKGRQSFCYFWDFAMFGNSNAHAWPCITFYQFLEASLQCGQNLNTHLAGLNIYGPWPKIRPTVLS